MTQITAVVRHLKMDQYILVTQMSLADVERSHGGDGGGDDHPPSHVECAVVLPLWEKVPQEAGKAAVHFRRVGQPCLTSGRTDSSRSRDLRRQSTSTCKMLQIPARLLFKAQALEADPTIWDFFDVEARSGGWVLHQMQSRPSSQPVDKSLKGMHRNRKGSRFMMSLFRRRQTVHRICLRELEWRWLRGSGGCGDDEESGDDEDDDGER
ncbi:hypothetical protein Tco_1111166 [Tanacetum coccineum]|uniref:Uncharacterized protein n=1 Tax=Tanacetum coccineum TaxID=301880 RepID=A0ABQ5IMY5_9ASTR